MGLIQKIFGTYSQRELKSIYPIADKIEALEEEYRGLTDEQLQTKTPEFKQRLQQGETLDDILPEAFAAWPGELVELNLAKGTGRGLWRVRESVCGLTAAGTYTRLTLGEP